MVERMRLICTLPNTAVVVLEGVEATNELVVNGLVNKTMLSALKEGFQINAQNGISYRAEVIPNG